MKIVIFSQHIFPIQTPRSHRTTELVKELSRQGHKITLYCVIGQHNYRNFCNDFGVEIHNIPSKLQFTPYTSDGAVERSFIDKVLGRLLGKLVEFPYIEFMFSIPAMVAKFKPNQFDLAISIADPHHIHWGCARAKKLYPDKFPSKWIADCGDPFMDNDTTQDHYSYFSYFEKKFCKSCEYITVPHKGAIQGYYPEFRSKINVIPQGFDFTIPYENSYDKISNTPITFAYAGVFLSDIRNPARFLDYLSQQNQDFKFIVYTPYRDLLNPYISRLGSRLEIREPIKREELLVELEKMDFLLNIENANTTTAVPSKLIDYAIVGRPVLSIHPNNPDFKNIDSFLKRDYTLHYVMDNLESYQISNVTKKFLALANTLNHV